MAEKKKVDFADVHDSDFNIILQTLLTGLKWEMDLRNALIMKNVEISAEILNDIIILIAPLLRIQASGKILKEMEHINSLVYSVPTVNISSNEGKKMYVNNQNEALKEIKGTWLHLRLAMQEKGLLYAKPKDIRKSILAQ